MAGSKFVNETGNIVQEVLEGFALAHPDKAGDNLVVRAVPKDKDKVALVTLGGSGHEPALSGFVGEGMLDISVPGEIFAAPGPPRVLEALRRANREAGVLFIVLNHAGDVLSANMAMDLAAQEGINVRMVMTHEDVSSGPRDTPEERRGLAGCLQVIKVAGAAAERGCGLEECAELAERMEKNLANLAVAVSSATHPATGDVIAQVPEGQMCVGMGQHGEAGGGTQALKTADETAAVMLEVLIDDLKIEAGERVLVMLNGVGATTLMELYVVLRGIKQVLDGKSIALVRSIVGEFLTVQEMGGFQLCIGRMDDELLQLWDAPCNTPALTIR